MDKNQIRAFRLALADPTETISTTDKRYVPDLHGSGAEDVMGALLEEIVTRPKQGTHLFYFTGQRGTGKSTELYRLESLLEAEGIQVVRFDSLDYISQTEKITAETTLLLVAAGLATWADEHYAKDFLQSPVWARFHGWLQTEVKLEGVSAAGLSMKLKEQQATVIEAIKNASSPIEWIKSIQGMAREMVDFIKVQSNKEQLVILVDSLEQLRGSGYSEQAAMFDHVVQTFSGDFDRLRIPGAGVVYSVPPYLSLLADVRSYVSVYSLASVRVFEKPLEGRVHGPNRRHARASGLEKMRQVVGRRFQDWERVLTPAALDQIALKSGGDLRHFMMRLLGNVLGKALFAIDRLPLGADDLIVQSVLDENRSETERLTTRDEWPELLEVAQSHNAVAGDRNQSLRTLAHLLDTRVILNYRNGSEWFDVHPLLWPLLDDYIAKSTATDAN